MDLHLSVTHQVRKESIGFPYSKRFVESFEKKSLKKSNIPETHQILKILSVAISSRIVDFQTLADNSGKPKFVYSKLKNYL